MSVATLDMYLGGQCTLVYQREGHHGDASEIGAQIHMHHMLTLNPAATKCHF